MAQEKSKIKNQKSKLEMNGKSLFFTSAVILILFLLFLPTAFAQSTYVLPYPSFMPDGIAYKIHIVWESIEKYWYFGSFGQYEYNLKESDKYLVEAKTLFDYKQYLLAVGSLKKSDAFFILASSYLESAKKEGKDIYIKKEEFKQAALKHKEVLQDLKTRVPKTFLWQQEKQSSSTLDLWGLLNNSIEIRKNYSS